MSAVRSYKNNRITTFVKIGWNAAHVVRIAYSILTQNKGAELYPLGGRKKAKSNYVPQNPVKPHHPLLTFLCIFVPFQQAAKEWMLIEIFHDKCKKFQVECFMRGKKPHHFFPGLNKVSVN